MTPKLSPIHAAVPSVIRSDELGQMGHDRPRYQDRTCWLAARLPIYSEPSYVLPTRADKPRPIDCRQGRTLMNNGQVPPTPRNGGQQPPIGNRAVNPQGASPRAPTSGVVGAGFSNTSSGQPLPHPPHPGGRPTPGRTGGPSPFQQPHPPQFYSQPQSKPRTNSMKLSIKVGAGVASVAALLAIAVGGYKVWNDTRAESMSASQEGASVDDIIDRLNSGGVLSRDEIDWVDMNMDNESYDEFMKRPLEQRLAYGNHKMASNGEVAIYRINRALGKYGRTIDKVPVLSDSSSAQDILDFDSICAAVGTMGAAGEKVLSLCNHDSNAVATPWTREYIRSNPNSVLIGILNATDSSEKYTKDGQTYITINSLDPHKNNTPQTTYVLEKFKSFYDNSNYVVWRLVHTTNPSRSDYIDDLTSLK